MQDFINGVLQPTNLRFNDLLLKCSDEMAIKIAETIAAHRLAGIETYSVEAMLNKEIERMNAATKIFYGEIPECVRYTEYNDLVKR